MSSATELVQAIRDRIAAGHDKAAVEAETLAAGHSKQIFEAAYLLAVESSDTSQSLDYIPSAVELYKEGLRFAKQHWRFVLLLGVVLSSLTVAGVIAETYSLNLPVLGVATTIIVLAIITYVVLLGMTFHLVTQTGEQFNYQDALAWFKQNFWKLIWVYSLMSLVVIGGYVLFIVPGVIATITLYFVIFVLVNEGLGGEAALLRSRQLVKDRWWLVFGKLLMIGLLNVLLVLGFGLIAGLLSLVVSVVGLSEEIVYEVIINLLAGITTVTSLYAINQLYRALSKRPLVTEISKTTYRLLGLVGGMLILAVVAVIVFLLQNPSTISWLAGFDSPETLELEDQLRFASFSGGMAAETTYDDMCELLQQLVTDADEVSCNDSSDAWALSARTGEEVLCIDSSGFNGSVPDMLGEAVVCEQ